MGSAESFGINGMGNSLGRLESNRSSTFLLGSMGLVQHVDKLFLVSSQPFELLPTRQLKGTADFGALMNMQRAINNNDIQ